MALKPTNGHPSLRLVGLSKQFPGQLALDHVDLEVHAGEIHALLGANGSGKSTLIKILAGFHQPEDGAQGWVSGRPLAVGAASAARAAGLHFIHQDLGLLPTLSVAENLNLGRIHGRRRFWVTERAERRRARELFCRHGIDIDPATPVSNLSAAEQTLVAITRAVGAGLGPGHVLVLDEPTAALPPEEVHRLFSMLDKLTETGVSVIYVTHRLQEVFEIADRVTVLREGRRVATEEVRNLDEDTLVTLILGRELLPSVPPVGAEFDRTPLLRVLNIVGGNVKRASLTAYRGEVLGITGLMGSGYEQVLRLIFGAIPAVTGSVVLDGVGEVPRNNPRAAIRCGVAFAAADRRRLGGVLDWSLRENVTLSAIPSWGPLRWMAVRSERRDAALWLDRLDVTPRDPERVFASLSGGNQQRVVIARLLRSGARVLLLDEPSFGVDAGARQALYSQLRTLTARGAAVVVSSSDAEELSLYADRILVMGDGKVCRELPGSSSIDEIFDQTVRATASASAPAG